MQQFFYMFAAELKRVFSNLRSYLGDSIPWLIYTLLMFVAIVAILNGISDGSYQQNEQLAVLVGWIIYQVGIGLITGLPEDIVNSRAVMSDRFSAKMQYWFSATMSYVFSPEMSDEIREELQRVMLWWFGFLLSKTPPVQKVGDFGCGSCHRG